MLMYCNTTLTKKGYLIIILPFSIWGSSLSGPHREDLHQTRPQKDRRLCYWTLRIGWVIRGASEKGN
jgi:hypothetical protein